MPATVTTSISHTVVLNFYTCCYSKNWIKIAERDGKKPQPATAKFFRQRLIKTSPIPWFYRRNGNTVLDSKMRYFGGIHIKRGN